MTPQSRETDEDLDEIDVDRYIIHSVQRDEGSVVVFRAVCVLDGLHVLLAVDHRSAQEIVETLQRNEPEIVAYAEAWQICGTWR